jgi:hypothetical protein
VSTATINAALESMGNAIAADPAKARAKATPATARLVEGLGFEVTGPKGETFRTDMPPAMGGTAAAPNPGWFMRGAPGTTLRVFIQPPGSGGMRFRPLVLRVERGRELRWKGKLLLPGLFDGEHYFMLEPGAGGVELRHGERFTGLLVPLLRKSLDGATRAGFVAMNEALKREAERR